jgi:hypothetical protein
MGKAIVLANIGNRNIRYFGKNPKIDLIGSEASFRESTKLLLENFEQESEFISAQILPEFFNAMNEDIQELVLFGSDSPQGTRNNQDTIYVARLLDRIFLRDGYLFSINVVPIRIRVVDINELMVFYRNFLNTLIENAPQRRFFICDAGGTTQQKTALKIIAEYLIPKENCRIFNVVLDKEKSYPEEIFSFEYRRVIDGHQCEALIKQFNFSGALLLQIQNNPGAGGTVVELLRIASDLFANHADKALKAIRQPSKNLKQVTLINRLMNNGYYAEPLKKWGAIFSEDAVFKLCLLLDIAEAHLKVKSWGFALLYHHIFIERFLHEILEPVVAPDNLIKNWGPIKNRIIDGEIFDNVSSLIGKNIYEVTGPSFPVLIELAYSLNEPLVRDVLDAISDQQRGNLSGKRNKFAHEGRSMGEADVKPFLTIFDSWRQTMGIPPACNIFEDFRFSIKQQLRK